MSKSNKLIILGTSAFAQVAYWYFKEDSEFEVVCFTANRDRIKQDTIEGLPVIPLEDIEKHYSPKEHYMFIAVGYTKLNKARKELFSELKSRGYSFATYIHSNVNQWPNNKFGENTFIFEDNTIQPYVEIGDNVVLWSGNHIGHHSKIGDHCFLTSHVVVSGFVDVGHSCFMGVNATLRDSISIGEETIIGAGALILKDTKAKEVYIGDKTEAVENKKSSDIKRF